MTLKMDMIISIVNSMPRYKLEDGEMISTMNLSNSYVKYDELMVTLKRLMTDDGDA